MHKNIFLLKLYNFCEDFRFYGAFIILYFTEITGSYALAMTVFSVGFLSQVFWEVPTGILSDRFLGRKKTLVLAAVCDLGAVFFYALAYDFIFLAVGAFFEGLSRALTSGTDSAFLYETLKDENQTDRFAFVSGKTSSMFQIALFTGGLIGASTVSYSYRFTVFLTLVPKIVQILTACFFIEPKSASFEKKNNDIRHAFKLFSKNKKLALFAFADAFDFAWGEASYQFKATFVRRIVPDWGVGIFASATNLFASVGFWFAGNIMSFFGSFKTFFVMNLVSWLSSFIGLLLGNLSSLFIFASASCGYGLLVTASQDVYQKHFSDSERATCASFVSLAGSLLLCLTAPFIGFLADKTNPVTALLIAVTVPKMVSLPVFWFLFRREKSTF